MSHYKSDLYHMDCRKYLALNPNVKFSAIITDPPYDSPEDWLNLFAPHCTGNIIMFCKPENQYFKADEYLFWIKTPSTKNFTKACGRFVEMILVKRGGMTFNRMHWSQMIGVYDDRQLLPPIHPYEKPMTLIERLVRIYTNPLDTIFDPFMGSGTTGVASIWHGRNFVGCETDIDYYLMAKNKIEGIG